MLTKFISYLLDFCPDALQVLLKSYNIIQFKFINFFFYFTKNDWLTIYNLIKNKKKRLEDLRNFSLKDYSITNIDKELIKL